MMIPMKLSATSKASLYSNEKKTSTSISSFPFLAFNDVVNQMFACSEIIFPNILSDCVATLYAYFNARMSN